MRVIVSPCVGLCRIDTETQRCEGCWRTLGEITRWISFSDVERAAVMGKLSQRQNARFDEWRAPD